MFTYGRHAGTWGFSSEEDPRWSYSVHFDDVSVVTVPSEVGTRMKEMERIYGEPPDDLEVWFKED